MLGDWTEEKLAAEMDKAVDFQSEDLLFAEKDGSIVGTAWALRQPNAPEGMGYVHMVAVAPPHRGRGLGRAVLLAVLHRFRELGMTQAELRTDDCRLPAIKIYLGLGFRPRLSHESHRGRWQAVYRKLSIDVEEIMHEMSSDQ
jgi:mycothiol synthase